MHAPIYFVYNRKRRPPQFVIQAAGNETANDRFAVGFALERPGRWRGASAPGRYHGRT